MTMLIVTIFIMIKFYFSDDSGEILNINELRLIDINSSELRSHDNTYDSALDAIKDLERKLEEMKWQLQCLNALTLLRPNLCNQTTNHWLIA